MWLRLVVGLLSVSLLAVLAASVGLYARFKKTNEQFREQTLQSEAHLIAKLVRRATLETRLKRTIDDILRLQNANAIYAVVDPDGRVILSSGYTTGPIWAIDGDKQEVFFARAGRTNAEPLYGITVRTTFLGAPAFVQIAVTQPEIFFDSVLAEFLADIAWIWIPFVLGLILLNLVIVRQAIRPLRRVVAQAEAIRPHQTAHLLDENGLPREVHALVASMNRAILRMHSALDTQANFIADASHELRTPLSVLKAHAAVLPDTTGVAALRRDVDTMARLVDQLLDSARLAGMAEGGSEPVELKALAHEVICQLGPSAILAGKKIELVSESDAVYVLGQRDFLFRAVRNVVENALIHTPPRTAVTVEIVSAGAIAVSDRGPGIPPEMRERIFQRFWQGSRDRSAGGAGLGLDIVRRTIEALDGGIVIGDAPGGGAMVRLDLRSVEGHIAEHPPMRRVGDMLETASK